MGFQFLLVLFSFLYYVSNTTILMDLVSSSSFQFLWVLLYSQKGVHQPQELFIHRASKVNWSVSIWEYLTSLFNKRQRKTDNMTAMKRRKLHFNWWLVFPQGWIIKMLVAEETFNSFLLTGISNISTFFIKKKNNLVFTINIYDPSALKILNNNVKKTLHKPTY